MIDDVRATQTELETTFNEAQEGVEAAAAQLLEKDPAKAKAFRTNYTNMTAQKMCRRDRPSIHASEEPMASAPVFQVSFSGEFQRLATMLIHLPFITAMRGYSVSSM